MHPPLCASCSSGQRFACGFLQIPPHDGHPCRPANDSPYRARLELSSYRNTSCQAYRCRDVPVGRLLGRIGGLKFFTDPTETFHRNVSTRNDSNIQFSPVLSTLPIVPNLLNSKIKLICPNILSYRMDSGRGNGIKHT